jgi:hypothetical protein
MALTQANLDALREAYGGPMTADEVAFLRDMQGFIDYAIRNGLNFMPVIAALGHDVNGVVRYGFDLAASEADRFKPKVTGFSNAGADAVGEPEPDVE